MGRAEEIANAVLWAVFGCGRLHRRTRSRRRRRPDGAVAVRVLKALRAPEDSNEMETGGASPDRGDLRHAHVDWSVVVDDGLYVRGYNGIRAGS